MVSAFLVNISSTNAHSPSSVSLQYAEDTNTLTVTISHSVSDPNTHYIENVQINVNGTEVLSEDYTSQPTNNQFVREYTIEAGAGATISATATCNLGGTSSDSLTVPGGTTDSNQEGDEEQNENGEDQTIPGYSSFLWIASGFIGILLLLESKKLRRVNTIGFK